MWFVIWIACGIAGGVIGSGKGRKGAGFALGFLLGPIGLVIAIFMKADTAAVEHEAVSSGALKKCPHCAEFVRSDAKICRYCGNGFD